MATTPSSNSVTPTGNNNIDSLLEGGSWTGMPIDGNGVPVLTFSFSIDSDFHVPWSLALKTTVRYAVDQWSAVANIQFEERDPNSITEQSTADIALTPTGTHLAQALGAV